MTKPNTLPTPESKTNTEPTTVTLAETTFAPVSWTLAPTQIVFTSVIVAFLTLPPNYWKTLEQIGYKAPKSIPLSPQKKWFNVYASQYPKSFKMATTKSGIYIASPEVKTQVIDLIEGGKSASRSDGSIDVPTDASGEIKPQRISSSTEFFANGVTALGMGITDGLLNNLKGNMIVRFSQGDKPQLTWKNKAKFGFCALDKRISQSSIVAVSFLYTSTLAKKLFPNDKRGAYIASALIGFVSGAVTTPIDIIQKRQASTYDLEAMRGKSTLSIIKDLNKEGKLAFIKGIKWNVVITGVAFLGVQLADTLSRRASSTFDAGIEWAINNYNERFITNRNQDDVSTSTTLPSVAAPIASEQTFGSSTERLGLPRLSSATWRSMSTPLPAPQPKGVNPRGLVRSASAPNLSVFKPNKANLRALTCHDSMQSFQKSCLGLWQSPKPLSAQPPLPNVSSLKNVSK